MIYEYLDESCCFLAFPIGAVVNASGQPKKNYPRIAVVRGL